MRKTFGQYLALACAAGLAGCPATSNETGDESTSSNPETTADTSSTDPPPTTTFMVECFPGEERCADDNTREVCNPTGFGWDPFPCTKYQKCSEQAGEPVVAACLGPCETLKETSIGCEFLAIRMRSENASEDPADADAIIVGNTDTVNTAEVQLYLIPNYNITKEEPQGVPIVLQPGESRVFKLYNSLLTNTSSFRTGGVYLVKSDYPISAYLHSPLANSNTNDASLLLPTKALGTEHIIPSFPAYNDAVMPDTANGRPSYFVVIATENDTEVEWTPRAATFGDGTAFDTVQAKQKATASLNRYDVIQVGALTGDDTNFKAQDVSGTIVRANKPVVVMGATSCAKVPFDSPGGSDCNHLQEQVIPTKYWGTKYVAANAPLRGTEKHIWRVYAGKPNQQIIVEPAVPGVPPFMLAEFGQYKEITFPSGVSTTFKSDAGFMAVQYIASRREVGPNDAFWFGDPAMYQTIPLEQHLKRYVFVTGDQYTQNYVQVIRRFNGADVLIDGVAVPDELWTHLNATGDLNVEFADVPLFTEGNTTPLPSSVHIAESDDPFGINVIGYVAKSAYAYPGGMALKTINPEGG